VVREGARERVYEFWLRVGDGEDVEEVCEDCGAEAGGPTAGVDDDGSCTLFPFSVFERDGELSHTGEVVVWVVFETRCC
jgi:hypothetical protein